MDARIRGTNRCLLALVVASAGLLSGCGEHMEEYTSTEGRYRVLLPGVPKPDKDSSLPAAIKKVALMQRSGSYEMAWQDLPASKDTDDERLDKACDGALKSIRGKTLTRKEILLDGHYPGRELVAELPDGKWIVHDRMYLVEGRLYHVMASGPQWWVESSQSQKVLNSFALVGK